VINESMTTGQRRASCNRTSILIPQSGRMLRRTHPTQYAAAINSFLKRRRVIRDSLVLPIQGPWSSAERW
jgi:hypothetical protein